MMIGRLLRRAFTAVLVLLGAAALLFALTLFIPGNPAQILLGPRATPAAVEAYAHAMGLDRPPLPRFLTYVGRLLRGDLGTDAISGRPVLALVLEALPYTLALTAAAIGLALLCGIPLGCYGALRPGSIMDRIAASASVAFIAVPNFVVAILLLLVFSTWLNWLPVLGTGPGPGGWGSLALRLVLPAATLALGWIGYVARLLRASMLEILGAAHIRTARAYGVPERRIVWRHALRLALVPLAAVVGMGVGQLLGGAVFIEVIFARPGLGTLIFNAIASRDYPVVQAGVLLAAGLFTGANLLVDVLVIWLDPRVADAAGRRAPMR